MEVDSEELFCILQFRIVQWLLSDYSSRTAQRSALLGRGELKL